MSLRASHGALNHEPGTDKAAMARRGHYEELRCVLAVIRHGDRTPKQKMKMKVTQVGALPAYQSTGRQRVSKISHAALHIACHMPACEAAGGVAKGICAADLGSGCCGRVLWRMRAREPHPGAATQAHEIRRQAGLSLG